MSTGKIMIPDEVDGVPKQLGGRTTTPPDMTTSQTRHLENGCDPLATTKEIKLQYVALFSGIYTHTHLICSSDLVPSDSTFIFHQYLPILAKLISLNVHT